MQNFIEVTRAQPWKIATRVKEFEQIPTSIPQFTSSFTIKTVKRQAFSGADD
jgi:hypothetical protein